MKKEIGFIGITRDQADIIRLALEERYDTLSELYKLDQISVGEMTHYTVNITRIKEKLRLLFDEV